jgi:transcriptional regulator with XRE-family HTH domain
MELVTVDAGWIPPKNWRMTDAERQRIGRKLKALRIERGLDQIPAADKAGISVGTLQAIERNRQQHPVKESNIDKYALAFNTSVRKLLRSDEIAPTDPRIVELNDEHLEIARSYMVAKRRPREAIEVLLSHPPAEEALSALLLRLATLPPERVHELDRWLTVAPHLLPLLEQVWRRMLIDPAYVAVLHEGATVRAQHPIPAAPPRTRPKGTPRTHATRRAK